MDNLDIYQLIDRYLNEEMTPEEKVAFESRLHEDSELGEDIFIN